MRREPSDFGGDRRLDGRDRVVVARLDAHHAGALGGAEADREQGAERDRHLAQDCAGQPLAQQTLDPVDQLDDLDATGEHPEHRGFVALVCRELAW